MRVDSFQEWKKGIVVRRKDSDRAIAADDKIPLVRSKTEAWTPRQWIGGILLSRKIVNIQRAKLFVSSMLNCDP
jgi:hypothetical protein